MTSGELSKVWTRGLCIASCLVLAGCMGSGSSEDDTNEGPPVVITPVDDPVDDDDDTTDTNDDTTDDDDDDATDVIADIITDIVTTSVSVTSMTSTGGS